jgi:hypothetical protein
MKDARAKLWELAHAKEHDDSLAGALILGAPRVDDILLASRVVDQLQSNLSELNAEATESGLAVKRVATEFEAADVLLELA